MPPRIYILLVVTLLPMANLLAQTNYVATSPGSSGPGTDNVLVGIGAGQNLTGTSNENVFVGRAAGRATTLANYNTFVGGYAGASNTGSGNSFFGEAAGYRNTNGFSNLFMGQLAGSENTTGNENIYLGRFAGQTNVSGNQNTFVGYEAGNLTKSSANVMLGYQAGTGNTAGTLNTFLGYQANVVSGASSLTNAAAIGANARVRVSNAIVLGDTTKNTKVGIGLTAPAFPLDVRGTINIRNQGALKFSQRVQLQSDDQDYLVLTASVPGHSGLRLAHLPSTAPGAGVASRVLSVDEQGRVGLYQPTVGAAQVRLQPQQAGDWADYVFAPGYRLAPLSDLARYVQTHHHLPGLPSAGTMVNEGIDLATLNAKLLEKVEELTLYLIEQQQELAVLRRQLAQLRLNPSNR